ncbi:hypothetical protein MES5069_400074 [Mesorhizobium escarrei]|uniref:Uncharacterized protein n=1 Tax=Mesorhizobium escarrei TaxID=666018 RepID=A0ABN8K639_9HYPH|nr:hypothetical protein MES5069_400074 [Mesorhizobium escarrei]
MRIQTDDIAAMALFLAADDSAFWVCWCGYYFERILILKG